MVAGETVKARRPSVDSLQDSASSVERLSFVDLSDATVREFKPMPQPTKKSTRKRGGVSFCRDPFFKREAGNYEKPIPSRELILEKLEKAGTPVQLDELHILLKLRDADQHEALRRRLIAMSRDGQLIRNRKGAFGLTSHMDLKTGKVVGKKDGYGFFEPEDGSEDFYLSAKEMASLFDGDRVMARVTGVDSRGRKEGSVVEILERRHEKIVGRYYEESGFGMIVPDSKRIPHELIIPDKHRHGATDGQFVVARITDYPSKRRKALAEVTEILGDVATPGVEIAIALRSFEIPHLWSAALKKQTRALSQEVSAEDTIGRFDLRDRQFVTIDGEDAKDFDDAVYAERARHGGWTLYVAIADVSHYVKPGSALDAEASNRGVSVYFPGHVVPMLPEKLSNGLCSLKPQTDRLAMVSEMRISADGELEAYRFYEAVIYSHARLTYTDVAVMLQRADTASELRLQDKLRQRHARLTGPLDTLYALFHSLRLGRERSGAMDFDSIETRMVFGKDRKIREIVPVERNDAHRLVEECMLCANVAAADLLENAKLPALYRIHEGPNQDKLDSLRDFLSEMGLYLGGRDKPTTGDYQKVLQQISKRPDRHLLQTQLIRSMMQAVYSPENCGHFGLNFSKYTHFTSPIRRYPDLLVHRAIRFLIHNMKSASLKAHPEQKTVSRADVYPYEFAELDRLGEQCSSAERRADAASYSVADWLKCEYMQNRVGDEFSGTITSVASFGLFIELSDYYVEGLVHITDLSNDYYHFDPVRHLLQGKRSGLTYQLGDSVTVRLVRVDLEEKKIDLQMVGSRRSRPSKGRLREALKAGKVGANTKTNSKIKKDQRKQCTTCSKGSADKRNGLRKSVRTISEKPAKSAKKRKTKKQTASATARKKAATRGAAKRQAGNGQGGKTASRNAANKKTRTRKSR